jgi:hypothetical protein
MNIPKGLHLNKWWQNAACKGRSIDRLRVVDCYGCCVRWECLWSAIDLDDRLIHKPVFIRGGLKSSVRGELWYRNGRDKLRSFVACQLESKRLEDKHRKQIKTSKRVG